MACTRDTQFAGHCQDKCGGPLLARKYLASSSNPFKVKAVKNAKEFSNFLSRELVVVEDEQIVSFDDVHLFSSNSIPVDLALNIVQPKLDECTEWKTKA